MSNVVEKDLKNWFADAKKIVLAGIGNPIRSDDYVGLKIVENLKGKVPDTVSLLECETVPENYLSEIEKFKPSHVMLIDDSAISTHALPLKIFCEHLKKATDAKIGLLLIEPKNMEFGEGLSAEVEAEAERLTKLLLELLVQRPLFFSKRNWQ